LLLYRLRGQKRSKYAAELNFWKRAAKNRPLRNVGYIDLFVTGFGLDKEFYRDKRILDIGCGPAGSLEWADIARERIGLDPLANSYKRLGTSRHAMKYVNAHAEAIPFPDGHFDIVTSINSLDHVDDLDETISEIMRVTSPGGYFLLMVEVNHPARLCEPITFSWDITKRFLPLMELIDEKHYELVPGRGLYSVRQAKPYAHDDTSERSGLLLARFRKKARDAQ